MQFFSYKGNCSRYDVRNPFRKPLTTILFLAPNATPKLMSKFFLFLQRLHAMWWKRHVIYQIIVVDHNLYHHQSIKRRLQPLQSNIATDHHYIRISLHVN